ncbi:hypothetical protein BD289DRAFT_449071 [Coniella lustricola]|uniref:DUF7053 domain-containing protein n=1 Tax=Coniella lustricola TaxID=2025994 RepID=A0A2T3ANK5_9PEZI|nr:hypothetical protein BD289DRAFT_449071 [Coniella lustricola]
MPASFDLELRFPIPARLTPELVIHNLHSYEPLIKPNPYLQSFQRIPVDLEDVVADTFFTEDGTDIVAYDVHDRIPVVFGLTKDVKFPAIFQAVARGVRVRADAAAGTRVRSVYEVCPRRYEQVTEEKDQRFRHYHHDQQLLQQQQQLQQQQGDIDAFLGHSTARSVNKEQQQDQWDLVETSHVECSAVLKPFVMKSFEAAHRDLCQKVLDNILEAATAKQVANALSSGF